MTVRTVWYRVTSLLAGPEGIHLKGHILPPAFYTYPDPIWYIDIMDTIFGLNGWTYDQTVTHEDPAAAWLSYLFYPAGRTITLSNIENFFTLLAQKYLIFPAENRNGLFIFQATTSRAKDYDIHDPLLCREIITTIKRFLWRDENKTVHYSGPANAPLHNLGYIDSIQGAPPANVASPRPFKSSRLQVHLKYRSGDCAKIGTATDYFQGRIKVTEVLDRRVDPAWHVIIEPLVWFNNTEGGAIPGTLEAAAPYTPLVTGPFNGILGGGDNNLQTAMESLDDHKHATVLSQIDYADLSGLPAAEVNSADIFRVGAVAGVSAWTGTIASLPGGAVLTVTTVSGLATALVPAQTSQLAKLRVYNLTRGTNARILNHVAATNTMTLDAAVPAGWQVGDSLTIASQTVVGAATAWVDLEIISGLNGRKFLFLGLQFTGGAVGDYLRFHPFEAFGAAKVFAPLLTQAANVNQAGFYLYKVNSNIITLAWGTTTSLVLVREAGYLQ